MAQKNISRRIRLNYATATISMTLVLFLLGAIGFVMFKLFTATEDLSKSVTMIVELKEDISDNDRAIIKDMLSANDMVATILEVSKEEKINDPDFKHAFTANMDGLLDENHNPLLDSYDVTLSAESADTSKLAAFAEEIRNIEGVSYVSYPEIVVEQLHSTLNIMQVVMILFGGVLLFISFMLLNNTIRLAVYSQRELINTLKAVGATKWFIMKPFVGRSALQGLVAGALSAAMLIGTLYGVEYAVRGLGIAIVPNYIYLGIIAAAMIVIGVVVAMICTLPIVSRFVNMKSNTIHLC